MSFPSVPVAEWVSEPDVPDVVSPVVLVVVSPAVDELDVVSLVVVLLVVVVFSVVVVSQNSTSQLWCDGPNALRTVSAIA